MRGWTGLRLREKKLLRGGRDWTGLDELKRRILSDCKVCSWVGLVGLIVRDYLDLLSLKCVSMIILTASGRGKVDLYSQVVCESAAPEALRYLN